MKTRWLNVLVLLSLCLGLVPPLSIQAAPPADAPSAPTAQDKPPFEVESDLATQLAADESTGYLIDFKG